MKAVIFLIVMIITAYASSQSADAIVTSAVEDFGNGLYKSSLNKLEQALNNRESLKPKNITKALYYKGLATEEFMTQLINEKNTEELKLHMSGYIDAYDAYVLCIKSDDNFKYEQKIINRFDQLQSAMLERGTQYHSLGHFKLAQSHYLSCISINEIYLNRIVYVPYNFLSQASLELKDTAQAYSSSKKAIQLYDTTASGSLDFNIGYVYHRLAKLAYDYTGINDIDLAISWTDKGLEFLDEESNKLESKNNARFLKEQKDFEKVIELLNDYQLNVLLKDKTELKTSLEALKSAVENHPKNYAKRVEYAQMLEDIGDFASAIKEYEMAIKIDSRSFAANEKLGMIYSSLSQDKIAESLRIDDYSKEISLQNEAKELIRISISYLEKAHKVDSKNLTIILALKNAFLQIDDEEGYEEFSEKEALLKQE